MKELLIGDFLIVLFIFIRIISMISVAPVLGHESIPSIVKISIGIVVSYITFLTIDKSKIALDINIIPIGINVVKEILTGFILGYMLNFVFYAISYSGTLIGFDMGLMMAETLNPMLNTNDNVVGQAIYYSAIMIFLLINGHHHVISAIVASFNVIPIGKFTMGPQVTGLIIKYSFSVFTIAVKIASPIIVSFFLIHIAEGIIARVIPNIQIIHVTQPAKLGLGFLFLSILAPVFIYAIKAILNTSEDQLMELIKTMGV
jgi:flagellar biosynthetic protein FliR